MKGYVTASGYMGLVEGRYILFPSEEEYLEYLENIRLRDHNKLGREMELFTTVDVIGQGLPLLMPRTWRTMSGAISAPRLRSWQRAICTRSPDTGIIIRTACSCWETRRWIRRYLPFGL